MKTPSDDERCFCQALSLHDVRSGVSRYILKLHVLAVLISLICSIVEANHKISLSVVIWYWRKVIKKVINLRGLIYIDFRNDKELSSKADSLLFQMYIPMAGFSRVHISAGYLMSERARDDYCCKEEDDFLQINNLLSVLLFLKITPKCLFLQPPFYGC
ncbi:hypothetical protein SAMN05878482_10668 [Peribacillus simplex]|uniref:Uncharacterized protein n=1 Tax=Peribacillus simplex TaxID=1478 RepID=A0A9X8WLZ7_9BACI|nr:hypothetical protein SAMN05878482_10668 [Peribacillus simplex]